MTGRWVPDMGSDPTSEAYGKVVSTNYTLGRHRVLNRRTVEMLALAIERAGCNLVVIQGSYILPEEAAADSGRTHSGGGVIGGDRS